MDEAYSGGGSLTLARFIDKAGDALIPELLQVYGVRLGETVRGRGHSPALILMYVRALPEGSPSRAALADHSHTAGWTAERHLLAGIFDAIRENTVIVSAPNFKKPLDLATWPRPKEDKEEGDPEEETPRSIEDLFNSLAIYQEV